MAGRRRTSTTTADSPRSSTSPDRASVVRSATGPRSSMPVRSSRGSAAGCLRPRWSRPPGGSAQATPTTQLRRAPALRKPSAAGSCPVPPRDPARVAPAASSQAETFNSSPGRPRTSARCTRKASARRGIARISRAECEKASAHSSHNSKAAISNAAWEYGNPTAKSTGNAMTIVAMAAAVSFNAGVPISPSPPVDHLIREV
jgi:hypothetical protein